MDLLITEKDQVFAQQISKPRDFKFSAQVAKVFDDMVNRSVPFYSEIQRMMAEIAAHHVISGTKIYDLGCSTGTTMIGLDAFIANDIAFVGVDDSQEMLIKCRSKLEAAGLVRAYDLIAEDITNGLTIDNASVVVLCLTLQFVRPICREKLLKKIFDGIVPGGVLLIVEKILAEDNLFNRNFIDYYYDYKRRNNYSDMEIHQKREALENVLIPYKLSENIHMLRESGFTQCETFFKWYNFAGIIAYKSQ